MPLTWLSGHPSDETMEAQLVTVNSGNVGRFRCEVLSGTWFLDGLTR